jgi:hypothetical protein
MLRIACSGTPFNCPRWRVVPTFELPDVEVPSDRQQISICLTREDVYPGVAAIGPQASRKQAA